jgi:hypothetical protein
MFLIRDLVITYLFTYQNSFLFLDLSVCRDLQASKVIIDAYLLLIIQTKNSH